MRQNCSGFTLIELLVVIAIIGILVGVTYDIFMDPIKAHAVESSRMFLQADFDKVHRMLDRDLRAASRVIPAMEDIRTSTTSLILEIPVASSEDKRIRTIRVHYSVVPSKIAELRGKGFILWRDTFKPTPTGWEKERSYPLSRNLSRVLFAADKPQWEQARWVSVRLVYRAEIVRTSLLLNRAKVICLRGASS